MVEEKSQLAAMNDKGKTMATKIIVFGITDAKTKKTMDYGVSIDQVQEIATCEEVTRVPGAPSHVTGVTNLRGRVITIVGMKEFLGLAPIAGHPDRISPNSRIIVVQVAGSIVGLLVDEVNDVLEVSPKDIEHAPSVLSQSAPYISGIAKKNSRLYVLLDMKRMFELKGTGQSIQPPDMTNLVGSEKGVQAPGSAQSNR